LLSTVLGTTNPESGIQKDQLLWQVWGQSAHPHIVQPNSCLHPLLTLSFLRFLPQPIQLKAGTTVHLKRRAKYQLPGGMLWAQNLTTQTGKARPQNSGPRPLVLAEAA
jgi:hypothetical protein